MTITIAWRRPFHGILYPCSRRSDAIWSRMSILGEKRWQGCSLAVLQQLRDLWNTLLPAKSTAGQLTE
uniref:AY109859 n=1 Tax=Arundo donax TaxID=35708 RepID=A0A0A9CVD3_ARUDO